MGKKRSVRGHIDHQDEPIILNGAQGDLEAPSIASVGANDNDARIITAEQNEYWAQQPVDDNGMLGGYPQVSRVDIQFSRNFLHKLRRLHSISDRTSRSSEQKTEHAFRDCLEVGAGIGRVTLGLLSSICERIDIVEPLERFTARLTARESPIVRTGQLRRVYNLSLQDWTAESAPSYNAGPDSDVQDDSSSENQGRYDLIWNQWCLNYLPNPALVRYFKSLIPLLAPDGWIIVKENISTAEGGADTFWEEDSSVTRTEANFKLCFEQAGLAIVRTQLQTGMPKILLPVRMYALRPASWE